MLQPTGLYYFMFPSSTDKLQSALISGFNVFWPNCFQLRKLKWGLLLLLSVTNEKTVFPQ